MALAVVNRTVVDDTGAVIPYASVEVRTVTDNSLASLYSDSGSQAPIANPITSDSRGLFKFYVTPGTYTIEAGNGVSSIIWTMDVGLGNTENTVATRAALKALTPGASHSSVVLTEVGRDGLWVHKSGAKPSSDPEEGVYLDSTQSGWHWQRAGISDRRFKISWFGATTSRDDNETAVVAAADVLDDLSGGTIIVDGAYNTTSPITLGDGSDSQQSTKHHDISIIGNGMSHGADVSNASDTGSGFVRTGLNTGYMIELNGPLLNTGLESIRLDCANIAQSGVDSIHVYQPKYERVLVERFSGIAYNWTTRSGFPSGVAYGSGEGYMTQCYSNDPTSDSARAIVLTSGVNSASSLASNPDTARLRINGGTYFYGGGVGGDGLHLNGADNNEINGAMFLPRSGATGGYDIYLQQWAGSGDFPKENKLYFYGTRGMGGNGGVGSSGPNTVSYFALDDGAPVPTLPSVLTKLHNGKTYLGASALSKHRGLETYLTQASQQTPSSTFVDVPNAQVTVEAKGGYLVANVSLGASKSTQGQGYIILNIDGADYGETQAFIGATGYLTSVSLRKTLAVSAGAHTVKVRFRTDGSSGDVVVHNTNLEAYEMY